MPDVLTNGVRLHVVELGTGPPVVMLHGLLVGNLASWYLTAAPALSRGHRVILYDLRGHGRSQRPPAGYDVPTMTEDLRGLLDQRVGDGPVDIVGHSYGALVGLQLALESPARVGRLAMVEAPLSLSQTRALTDWLDQPADSLARALPEPLQVDLARGGRRARRLLSSLAALATETSVLADIAAQRDLPDALLSSLACPLLAVYGRRSSCRAQAARLRRLLPAARVVELDGGHYLPMEAPGELTAVLEEFLHG